MRDIFNSMLTLIIIALYVVAPVGIFLFLFATAVNYLTCGV